ncbi:MAG TPA: UbiA family prenyltransferase [Chthoniobacterales bacterium]|jgi:4-hydroxybenzoate polyprenyltransferase
MNKWWIYQRERFPVFAHGCLIAAFSFSAVACSTLLRGGDVPSWGSVAVAFVNSFLAFLQLRIADEFKDFEEDSRFRAYRPVPRRLVTLRELGWLGALTAAMQILLALALTPRLLPYLAITWIYLALMSREFFVRKWLQGKPVTYLLSHMLIMPLIDFYATACDWLLHGTSAPSGLAWFVAVSFCNGVVIELGRKIRSPKEEETGVNTYTALWGRPAAIGAWWLALALTLGCAWMAAVRIHFVTPTLLALGLLLCAAVFLGCRFLCRPEGAWMKKFETLSGIWTLLLYLFLGAIPLGWRLIH